MFGFVFSDTNGNHDIHIGEWRLVYSPENQVFEHLLGHVVSGLNFSGVYGVKTSEEVEKLMLEQEFVAGVVFNHSAVKLSLVLHNFQVQ